MMSVAAVTAVTRVTMSEATSAMTEAATVSVTVSGVPESVSTMSVAT